MEQKKDKKPYRKLDKEEVKSERKPYKKTYKKEEKSERKSYNKFVKEEEKSDRKPFKKRYNKEEKSDRKPYNKFDKGEEKLERKPFKKEGKSYKKPYKKDEKLDEKEEPTDMRLNKYIANSGLCSRRKADEYIQDGEISVNGKVVTELGVKVMPGDTVKHNGKLLRGEKNVYILMNKPRNTITTLKDTEDRLTIVDLLHGKVKERVYPVGRLDRNTTGVILLTNDGALTKKLTHPSSNISKVYFVTLDKALSKEDLVEIANGLELEDGFIQVDKISYTNNDDKREIGIEIHSGRNRIIRRLFEKVGYEVIRLDRTYFAGLTKKSLRRGYWRHLESKEVGFLKMLKGGN